jgi:hypothetical protein
MAMTDQKARYRRQADLCYEIATMIGGEKAATMVRLGDTYSSLATTPPDAQRARSLPETKNNHPVCPHCGTKVRLIHSLPRTDLLSAMQGFRCDSCGATLVWKSK